MTDLSYQVTSNGIALFHSENFDLEQTLDCGQCFRWDKQQDGAWKGVAFGKALRILPDKNYFLFDGIDKEVFVNTWFPYFDLDRDYELIRKTLAKSHPVLQEAVKFAPGIRILRQEPWEALCSFIISQNNNIPRIKGIISRLCSCFGEDLGDGAYSFPAASQLAELTVEDLAPIRSGFRAKYILSAAKMVAEGTIQMDKISPLSIEDAREKLMMIKGVGVKVAECALLYGFHRLEAFPMDVWMKRAMENLFPGYSPRDFGEYAGVAQQYIFHYSRCNPDLFQERTAV